MSSEVHPVDEVLPVPRLLALGLQQCAVVSVLLNAFFNGLSGGAAAEADAAAVASSAQHA